MGANRAEAGFGGGHLGMVTLVGGGGEGWGVVKWNVTGTRPRRGMARRDVRGLSGSGYSLLE
jgi:hypothetical protein